MQWTTIMHNRLTEMMQWNSNQLHQIAAVAAAEIQFAVCYLISQCHHCHRPDR